MADNYNAMLGKKIFFLHPSPFIQNTVLEILSEQELEIYVVKDETKAQRILAKYPDSIVFANIEEKLSPEQWQDWFRQIKNNEATKNVSIGILSVANSDEVRNLYLKTFQVSCGFIPIKADKNTVVKALMDKLNAAEAKGRRKYLRVSTLNDTKASINISLGDNNFINGEIQDISAVGLSCIFPQDPDIKKNSLFSGIQVKLHGALLKAEGIALGSRTEGDRKLYVFLFTKKTDPAVQAKIKTFIQKTLQSRMDFELG
jgi:hypothetical protein